LNNENLDTNYKDGFGDKNKAGKEFNLKMKQENNDSIPRKNMHTKNFLMMTKNLIKMNMLI
jgi:hypothetical protein